jgi:cytidine deaminase
LDHARGSDGVSATKKEVDELEEAIGELITSAREAREKAYAPYSKYRVGAALVTKTGDVFIGCNVENATYGATICAERGAIMTMVAAGAKSPVVCVVVTGGAEPASPCGICRQVLAEFADDMLIVMVADGPRGKSVRRDATLASLLPLAFRLREKKR